MALGALLVVVSLLLALRTVLTAPSSAPRTAAPTAPVATPAPSPGAPDASTTPVPGTPAAVGGTDPAAELRVHVAGAVNAPGIVGLPPGSRVADAVEAAGGASPDADTDRINLARPVVDGEQVRVPRVGEELPTDAGQAAGATPTTAAPGPGAASASSAGTAGEGGKININTATAAELEELPGIGPALAERIVAHRQANGPFASVDDLVQVPGIGTAKLEALRAEATV